MCSKSSSYWAPQSSAKQVHLHQLMDSRRVSSESHRLRLFQRCMCVFQVQPNEMKAISKFDEANKLQIDDGDMIIVIDGR